MKANMMRPYIEIFFTIIGYLLFIYCSSVLIFLGMIILEIISSLMPDFISINAHENISWILFCFPLGIIIYTYMTYIDNYKTNNGHLYKRFFEHARKSMATVIRINYMSVYRDLKYVEKPDSHCAFYPTWEITYSFNPPDDSSPDPIVRTFKTHTLPDALHEGSLIPILYLIQNDEEGEHVLSTPFPVPASDNLEISNN